MDLAKNLIRMNGFEPGRDIEIIYTGIRPGEKLFEELLTAEEGVNQTTHEKIFAARQLEETSLEDIEAVIADFLINQNDADKVVDRIKNLVQFQDG